MRDNEYHSNNPVRVVIIEDELSARELIESMLNELEPGWEIDARLGSVESAIDWFKSNKHPDLIFVDIQLSDGLSFEIFDQVDYDGMVIFTTAYDEYTLQAFRVNSIDYLLKPIRMRELRRAIEKYRSWVQKRESEVPTAANLATLLKNFSDREPVYRTRFLIRRGESYAIVQVNEIAYFHTIGHEAIAVTNKGTKQVVDFTLDELEEQLNPRDFFRISRQMIVHINAIHKIHRLFNGRLSLDLEPDYEGEVTVSRQRVSDFKLWIDR